MAFQWLFKEISKTWGCREGETTLQLLPGRSKVLRVTLTHGKDLKSTDPWISMNPYTCRWNIAQNAPCDIRRDSWNFPYQAFITCHLFVLFPKPPRSRMETAGALPHQDFQPADPVLGWHPSSGSSGWSVDPNWTMLKQRIHLRKWPTHGCSFPKWWSYPEDFCEILWQGDGVETLIDLLIFLFLKFGFFSLHLFILDDVMTLTTFVVPQTRRGSFLADFKPARLVPDGCWGICAVATGTLGICGRTS